MGHGHMLRALLALCALRACSASKVEGEARDQARQAGVWDDIVEEEDFRDFEGARVLGASAGGSMGPTTPPPTPSLHAQIHCTYFAPPLRACSARHSPSLPRQSSARTDNGTCDGGANALTSAECTLYAAESNLKRNTGRRTFQYRNIYPAGPFGQVR